MTSNVTDFNITLNQTNQTNQTNLNLTQVNEQLNETLNNLTIIVNQTFNLLNNSLNNSSFCDNAISYDEYNITMNGTNTTRNTEVTRPSIF
jgi:GTP-sensing pleiotropic transcriptional regulator CodY